MDYFAEGARLLRALSGARDDMAGRADYAARYAAGEAKDIGRIVARFAAELTEALSERAEQAGRNASSGLSAVGVTRENAAAAQQLVADEVRARPLQAMMVVAATGLILGWLFKR
jgi:ElaB/YqjD/DUF883 family membrane-anchored ribosome-binding protein